MKEPCQKVPIAGSIIGAPCFDCGHTNMVHPGSHNPAITVCVLCEMEPVRHLEALDLRPGDTLVFRSPDQIDDATADHLGKYFESRLTGHKVIILENGADLGVIRAEVQP